MIIKNSRPIVRMSNSFHSREAALYPMLELATTLVVLSAAPATLPSQAL